MSVKTVRLAAAVLLFVAALASADPLVHVVAKGETLYGIARRYDVTVEAIMKANDLSDPGRISAGMKLTIPSASATTTTPPATATPSATIAYVVRKGDTLYGIAKAHGVSVDAIVKASALSSSTIKEGQTLRIPQAAVAAKPADSPAGGAAPAGGTAAAAVKPAASPKPAAAAPAASLTDKAIAWPVSGQVSYLQGKLKGVSIEASSSTISAIRAGTVISAGPFRGFGKVAFVESRDGLVYVYGGAESLDVKVGDAVRKGATIGTLASSRLMYFFVFNKNADTIDPLSVPRD